jgi:hypothetical protein
MPSAPAALFALAQTALAADAVAYFRLAPD